MKEIKTKVGTFYSVIDLPFQISTCALTLSDFDGDQITYDMYLEGRRSIIEYEKRMVASQIAEDFESVTPAENALDAIPTPDPKKQKPSSKEIAKRKINGLSRG